MCVCVRARAFPDVYKTKNEKISAANKSHAFIIRAIKKLAWGLAYPVKFLSSTVCPAVWAYRYREGVPKTFEEATAPPTMVT